MWSKISSSAKRKKEDIIKPSGNQKAPFDQAYPQYVALTFAWGEVHGLSQGLQQPTVETETL